MNKRKDHNKRQKFESIYELYMEFMQNRHHQPKDSNNEVTSIAYIIALNDDQPQSKSQFMDSLRRQGVAITEDEGIDWIYPSTG